MSKGTARAITNIKPMDGGTTIAQLMIGDYVYGTVGATDIMGFSHYYRAGTKIPLGKPCKAYIGSGATAMNITSEAEPNLPPPVIPPVVTNPEFPDYFILESPTGERVRYARAAL